MYVSTALKTLCFFSFPVLLYYNSLHTNVFTYVTVLLVYCVSFCVQLDGVCLSGNKRIYLLTYLLAYLLYLIL